MKGARAIGLRALVAALAPLSGLAGCGGSDATGPNGPITGDGLEIAVEGRVERGLEIQLGLLEDGQAVSDSLVTWRADPVEAVELDGAGAARLLRAGPVSIYAELDERSTETVLEVAVPPVIVFDLLQDGNRDIYRAELDGRGPVRLTEHPGDDADPTVGGGRVVFTSARDGGLDLYSVPLAGGTVVRLTDGPAADVEPALSADGQRLAFVRNESGAFELWTAAGDGDAAAPATPDFGFDGSVEAAPSWAPAGDRLVFVSTDAGRADLYELVGATGDVTEWVSSPAADVEPAWSHDGRAIAFATDRDGDTEVYMLEPDSTEPLRLTNRPGTDAQPAWLPDGRIVYRARVDGEPRLRWLDPAEPAAAHEIPLPPGRPGNPAGVPR